MEKSFNFFFYLWHWKNRILLNIVRKVSHSQHWDSQISFFTENYRYCFVNWPFRSFPCINWHYILLYFGDLNGISLFNMPKCFLNLVLCNSNSLLMNLPYLFHYCFKFKAWISSYWKIQILQIKAKQLIIPVPPRRNCFLYCKQKWNDSCCTPST